jgi:hypothetical protein
MQNLMTIINTDLVSGRNRKHRPTRRPQTLVSLTLKLQSPTATLHQATFPPGDVDATLHSEEEKNRFEYSGRGEMTALEFLMIREE